MELIGPSDVRLDEVTTSMLSDVHELAHQVNEIRPLRPEVLRQVRDELFAERVFSSNAIEGNTLTIRETRLILQTKSILDIRRKREAQEALNLGEASGRMEQLLEVEEAWHDVSNFLAIHEILMKGVNEPIAGRIRDRDVMITGARHQPPGPMEASALIDEVFLILGQSENVHGFLLARKFHSNF
jgi:Fic family protein